MVMLLISKVDVQKWDPKFADKTFLWFFFTAVEVNYMDDVGQTLLNWASAFGTQEMVEFLCERGADVNRGQRSSSLHYAACFGRPQVAKVKNLGWENKYKTKEYMLIKIVMMILMVRVDLWHKEVVELFTQLLNKYQKQKKIESSSLNFQSHNPLAYISRLFTVEQT